MPLVVATAVSSYATVGEVRGYDDTLTATNDEIQGALDVATAYIDARAGRGFGTFDTGTRTFYDIRTDTVVIDDPFSDITDTLVDGYSVPANAIQVMPWGIRFTGRNFTPWNFLTRSDFLRGSTVTVSATFGAEIPVLIKRAAILLALSELGAGSSGGSSGGSLLPDIPGNVKSLSVEGLSVTLDTGDSSSTPSTGNVTADRLIDMAMGTTVGIV